MRVKVLPGQCAGHSLCSATAPAVFDLGEDGYVELIMAGDIPAELETDARAAVATCPERALVIEE
jgi:ferredoxin